MGILPYKRFDVRTDLTPGEIAQRLSMHVTTETALNFFDQGLGNRGRPFTGTITVNSFVIARSCGGFRPTFEGRVTPDARGSTIRIAVSPHGLVGFSAMVQLVAAPFIMFVFAIIAGLVVLAMSEEYIVAIIAAVFAFGVLMLGWVLSWQNGIRRFHREVETAKEFFASLWGPSVKIREVGV